MLQNQSSGGEKIKGNNPPGNMSEFQSAAGDHRKSTVIFKLVLNILFFPQPLFTKSKFIYALCQMPLWGFLWRDFLPFLCFESSWEVKKLGGLWKWKSMQRTGTRPWWSSGQGHPLDAVCPVSKEHSPFSGFCIASCLGDPLHNEAGHRS